MVVHARLDDPVQKVMFLDGHWIRAEGSQAVIDEESGVLYLGLALRNVGTGIAVLQGWYPWLDLVTADVDHPPAEDFRRQSRDIYIAPGEVGMWQGALRDANDDVIRGIAAARAERRPFTPDLLYSDQVGGQRTISRFGVTPVGEDRWLGHVGLHWHLDSAGPR